MIKATDDTFGEIVSDGISMVKFHTSTCGPCKTLGMILSKAEDEISQMGIRMVSVNISECPKTAEMFDISTVPEVHIVKDGDYIEGFVGMRTKKQIMEILEDALR